MKNNYAIQKVILFVFLFISEKPCNGQIHGLTKDYYNDPSLIVCQNGKVGTYGGICQSTIVMNQATLNCNGAIYTSSNNIVTGNSTSTFLPLFNNLQNIKQAAVFSSFNNPNYNAALDNNGVLYTWGSNHKGQLGTGNTNPVVTPTPVLTNVKTIVNIKEKYHTVLVNEYMMVIKNDNSLWGWGDNSSGCLGTGAPGGFNPNPVQILTNVKKAVCSGSTCIALKNDGTLWAWGKNIFSDLYCNTNYTQSILPPTKLDKFTTPIKDFDFTSHNFDVFLIAIDNNNKIYYTYDPYSSFGTVKNFNFSNINKVYSHRCRTYFLLTNNGEVYTFGDMDYYQGTSFSYYDTIPKKISLLSNILELYTTGTNVYFLRNDGKLFVSGMNNNFLYEKHSCGTTSGFINVCEVYLGCNILVGNKEYVTEFNDIKIYPNPTHNTLQLFANSKETIEEIQISDISGKSIKLNPERSGEEYVLNVSNLTSGIYFAHIKLKGYPTLTKKFIIQR